MSKLQPDAEMIRKVTEFAQKVAWKNPDLQVLKPEFAGQYPLIAETIQDHLVRSDRRQKLVLPDLRAFANQSVGVFTDYGGESSDAKFRTYSTLVCGWNLTNPFVEAMTSVRNIHRLGEKEIAFKDFGMGQIARALPGYLNALDRVPGFLFTLAVDRQLSSIFGPQTKEARERIGQDLEAAGLGVRKPAVNEKLLRIVHVAALLTGLLTHDGQQIFWMTDKDSIVPSQEQHGYALDLFGRILTMYARDGFSFPSLMGFTPFEQRNLVLLDLLSSTDVVAGAVEQYLTRWRSTDPADIQVKEGCDLVLQWLAHDGLGLKKMNVMLRPGAGENIEAVTLEFDLQNPPDDPIIIPVPV